MDRTPLEIWAKILGHACTDSGVTGRRLSLVSKFIREASAAVKLQSISIHGRWQMIAFYQLLQQTPPHLRHIRYLFLSTTPLPPTGRGLAHFAPPPMTSKREESLVDGEETEQLRTACQGVLAAVAECVEILYLDVRAEHLRWYLPTTSFPQLAELASNGPVIPVSHTIPELNTTPCSPYPKLRCWHLTGLHLMWRGEGAFATIRTAAPAITHARFSGLREYSGFVSDMRAGLPETIQHFYVKPAGLPAGWRGNARASYRNFRDGLKMLNLTDSRLVLLPEYRTDENFGTCTTSEWEERINGGDGCWSLRERVLPEINCD
ncbi:hypothetical protein FIBSPDRAFT_142097 [Athelia psychrophila]|uniref:F-box domain-containing protein n=1 Tax=Athelia psychrophila TaxID=1759441 RepID=A0A166T0B5_9AGAM|nr:hypothetical protein FIBSPDRAFT_142097 [Fibularhizoctonia sp. CBS 109695]